MKPAAEAEDEKTPRQADLKLGISACLLGRPVRWDGTSRPVPGLLEIFDGHVSWVEVCPEQGLGLGVPRAPIELRLQGGRQRLQRVEDGHDLTETMDAWVETCCRALKDSQLDGYITKARSPSCGAGTTPIHDAARRVVTHGDGRFAAGLRQYLPTLPLADESIAGDPQRLGHFVARVVARARLRESSTRAEQATRRRELLQLCLHTGSEPGASWDRGGLDDWRGLHAAALAHPLHPQRAERGFAAWLRWEGLHQAVPRLPWKKLWELRMAEEPAQPAWCARAAWFRPHPLERRLTAPEGGSEPQA